MSVQTRNHLSIPHVIHVDRIVVRAGNDAVIIELQAGDDVGAGSSERDVRFHLRGKPSFAGDKALAIELFDRDGISHWRLRQSSWDRRHGSWQSPSLSGFELFDESPTCLDLGFFTLFVIVANPKAIPDHVLLPHPAIAVDDVKPGRADLSG